MKNTSVMEPQGAALPVVALLVGSVLWGLSWLPLKYFSRFGIEGITVSLVAYGAIGAPGIVWLAARRRIWRHRGIGMVTLALLGGVANLAFATAIVAGDVVRVMVLFYLLPVWGVIGGKLALGEHVDGRRKLGVVCALLGAFLVLGGFNVVKRGPTAIDVVAIVAGMAFAGQNIGFRKLSDVAMPAKVAAVFAGCFSLAVILMLLGVGEVPRAVPALVWGQLAAFGAVYLLAATLTSLWGVAHMEAGRSSILIISELLTAVVSAAVLSQRSLSTLEWLGGGLIVIAAVLEAWRPEPAGTRPETV